MVLSDNGLSKARDALANFFHVAVAIGELCNIFPRQINATPPNPHNNQQIVIKEGSIKKNLLHEKKRAETINGCH